jgi:hypothetical protein
VTNICTATNAMTSKSWQKLGKVYKNDTYVSKKKKIEYSSRDGQKTWTLWELNPRPFTVIT